MDKAELMQKEIENKRKLPEEIKLEIKKSIFHNIFIALIIILYVCIINVLFYKFSNTVFEKQMKILALCMICITVTIFEIAYRRQSKRVAIIGVEILLCSIISLYIPYIYLFSEFNLKIITTILILSVGIYYIIKAILIYKTKQIQHENNLSDIKEILKETDKKGYLEEKSTKLYKELKLQEEREKKELLAKQKEVQQKRKTNANKKTVENKNVKAKGKKKEKIKSKT